MYWAGFTQYFMWQEFTKEGLLKYPNFLETVIQLRPMHMMRALGGFLYLSGFVLLTYNIIKTVKAGSLLANEEAEAPALTKDEGSHAGEHWHRVFERKPIQFMVLSLVVVLIGGAIEIVPTFLVKSNIPTIVEVKPYTPLELQGRDLYIREGCYVCHSQMVRPLRFETERYGEYSKAGEFVYDHPFQWGSKRTGPDLAREGVGNLKKSDAWHYNHLLDPRSLSPGSIMPTFQWLHDNKLDTASTPAKIRAMQTLGVPYPEGYDKKANADLVIQANGIAESLKKEKIETSSDKEIIAIIAYLQRLGKDITSSKSASTATTKP
jgi:cytochrome c oxidase cbb3-type subunit I/II